MQEATVSNWVEAYKTAWGSNKPDDIGPLFSTDAAYYTGPFAKPIEGRAAIVDWWIQHADKPGDYTFRYELLGTGSDSGIVRALVNYVNEGHEYSNIWLIRLNDEGQCTEFTEWVVRRPKAGAGA